MEPTTERTLLNLAHMQRALQTLDGADDGLGEVQPYVPRSGLVVPPLPPPGRGSDINSGQNGAMSVELQSRCSSFDFDVIAVDRFRQPPSHRPQPGPTPPDSHMTPPLQKRPLPPTVIPLAHQQDTLAFDAVRMGNMSDDGSEPSFSFEVPFTGTEAPLARHGTNRFEDDRTRNQGAATFEMQSCHSASPKDNSAHNAENERSTSPCRQHPWHAVLKQAGHGNNTANDRQSPRTPQPHALHQGMAHPLEFTPTSGMKTLPEDPHHAATRNPIDIIMDGLRIGGELAAEVEAAGHRPATTRQHPQSALARSPQCLRRDSLAADSPVSATLEKKSSVVTFCVDSQYRNDDTIAGGSETATQMELNMNAVAMDRPCVGRVRTQRYRKHIIVLLVGAVIALGIVICVSILYFS